MNNIYNSHARFSTNMKNYFWKKVVNIKKKSIVKMAAFFMFNIGGWRWQERQNCINENCHIYYYVLHNIRNFFFAGKKRFNHSFVKNTLKMSSINRHLVLLLDIFILKACWIELSQETLQLQNTSMYDKKMIAITNITIF